MPKQHDDSPVHDPASWPGPVGWWYVPLIWTVVALAAALIASFG
jgi:hypothetical protein